MLLLPWRITPVLVAALTTAASYNWKLCGAAALPEGIMYAPQFFIFSASSASNWGSLSHVTKLKLQRRLEAVNFQLLKWKKSLK